MRIVDFRSLPQKEFFVTDITVTSGTRSGLKLSGRLRRNYLIFTAGQESTTLTYLPHGAETVLPAEKESYRRRKSDLVDHFPPYCVVVQFLLKDASFRDFALSETLWHEDSMLMENYRGPFRTLCASAAAKCPPAALAAMLTQLMLSFCKDFYGEAAKPVRDHDIYAAVQYLEGADLAAISIPQLAEISGLSASCFRRKFREEFGISPTEYLAGHRLRKAGQLLAEGNLTVREVAEKLGYDSPSYFVKFYKSRTGRNPSDDLGKRKNGR